MIMIDDDDDDNDDDVPDVLIVSERQYLLMKELSPQLALTVLHYKNKRPNDHF